MRTRTFCPGCGGYRDIEDGHRVCAFCEYLDDAAKRTLPHILAPRHFTVDGVIFTMTFVTEQGYVVAAIDVGDPACRLLAECLTIAWKLRPVDLLESLCDHRAVTVGEEFCTIIYGDDPDNDEGNPSGVTIVDGENELSVPVAFFTALVLQMAKTHLQAAGRVHFPWIGALSPAAMEKIIG